MAEPTQEQRETARVFAGLLEREIYPNNNGYLVGLAGVRLIANLLAAERDKALEVPAQRVVIVCDGKAMARSASGDHYARHRHRRKGVPL